MANLAMIAGWFINIFCKQIKIVKKKFGLNTAELVYINSVI